MRSFMLWASLPSLALAGAGEHLVSTQINTGFDVVFEYVTASNCDSISPTLLHECPSPVQTDTHEVKYMHGKETESARTYTYAYTTVIPQICPTGWNDVTYTISETTTCTGTETFQKPKPTKGGKPPPGFTVTTTKCSACGPGTSSVTVTVPYRTREPEEPSKSVISCTQGTYVPSMPSEPVVYPTTWHPTSTPDTEPTSSLSPSSSNPAITSDVSSFAPVSSQEPSSASSAVESSSSLASSSTEPSSSGISSAVSSAVASSAVSSAVTSSAVSSAVTSSVASSYTEISSAVISSAASSSSPSQSSSNPPASSTESEVLPIQTPVCVPSFSLVGASENTFNPAFTPFTLKLSCGTLAKNNYTVMANFVPVIGTTSTETTIGIDSMANHKLLTVIAYETSGYPIVQTFSLLFGSYTFQVSVVDGKTGDPVSGATVNVTASNYPGIGLVATTNGEGIASFTNVPSTSLGIRAVGPEGSNASGVGSAAGGVDSFVTVKLNAFNPPPEGQNPEQDGFNVNNGLSGWTGGNLVTTGSSIPNKLRFLRRSGGENVLHTVPGLIKRQTGGPVTTLVIDTAFSQALQTARKTFSLPSDVTTVFIEYQFQTDEVPGGFFGSRYNDYFSVSIRTDVDGQEMFVTHSMNELGLGAFNYATGQTDWFTTTLEIPPDSGANSVEFQVAVANVADELYQSKVTVRLVGVCDRCETCERCSALAKCQGSCKAPALDSCAFWRSCAEETFRCGEAGFLIAKGERTCNKFQAVLDKFSNEGQTFVPKAEQCMQQAVADILGGTTAGDTCDKTCDAVGATGLNSLPGCFVNNGFCSLKGIDYARLLAILDDEDYQNKIRQAASMEVDCVERIFDALDEDIVDRIAAAARGENVAQNVADVWAMAAARLFFLHVPKDSYLSAADAVQHVQQVYDTALALGQGNANERVMDYYRKDDYNNWYWTYFVGVVNPVWVELARQHGVVPFKGFQDPAAPQINVGFSHLFASMIGVYFHGDRSTVSDITGWLGDLFQLYGETPAGTTPAAHCQTHFGSATLSGGFKAEDLRQDADAFNIGRSIRGGASVADAFRSVLLGGGYATRMQRFFNGRFDGSVTVAKETCVDYMRTLISPYVVAARSSFAGYKIPPWDTAVTDEFCQCFASKLAAFAASG